MERLFGYPLRGAFGFGLGLFVTGFAGEYAPGSILINLLGALAGGAIGGAALVAGEDFKPRAVAGFGGSFCLLWLMVVFTHISIQGGGQPSFTWGAIGSGIGFAAGGAMGAATIRKGLILPGAISFGVAGALGGLMSFYLIDYGYVEGSMPAAYGLAGVLAGGSFGASIEFLGD